MKATGMIKITDELTLTNPNLEILKVSYDWVAQTVDIELEFKEGSYSHIRTFSYKTDGRGELTSKDIMDFLQNDKVLSVFS